MLFHVRMNVSLPHDDAARSRPTSSSRPRRSCAQHLQREGKWRHLWRIAGQYANVSIFDVDSVDELHDAADHPAAVPLHADRGDAAVPPSVVDPRRRP